MHKPRGIITTKSDTHGRKTVYEFIPKEYHALHPIGRLDKDTTGALLLTNDGECTLHLTHPRYEVEKIYEATLRGEINDSTVKNIERGIMLEDGKTLPAKVKVVKRKDNKTRLILTIKEGKKRQIRRMFEAIGPVRIGALGAGTYRHLTAGEVKKIKERINADTE